MVRVNRALLGSALRIVRPSISYGQHLQISYDKGSDHLEISNAGIPEASLHRATCFVPLQERSKQSALWHLRAKPLMYWLYNQDTESVSLASSGDEHLFVEDVSRGDWIKLHLTLGVVRASATKIKPKHTLVFDQLGLIEKLNVLLRVIEQGDIRPVLANVHLEYDETDLAVRATTSDGFRLTQYRIRTDTIGVVQSTDGVSKHSVLLPRDFVKAVVRAGKAFPGGSVTLEITEDNLAQVAFKRAGVSVQIITGLYDGCYPNVAILTRKTTGSVRSVAFVRTDLLRIARQAAAIDAQAALLTNEDMFITLESVHEEEKVYASMGAKNVGPPLPKIALRPNFLVDALQSLDGKFTRLMTNPEPGKPLQFSDDDEGCVHVLMPMHMPDMTK